MKPPANCNASLTRPNSTHNACSKWKNASTPSTRPHANTAYNRKNYRDCKSLFKSSSTHLNATDEKLDALRSERDTALTSYRKKAEKLSKQRRSAAAKMKKSIEAKLSELAMKHCQIEFAITPLDNDHPHSHGNEDIEILIRSNPNSAMGPLHKIASGGELSRISLAIQVVTAQVATVPTVVFDEVDVGIGGATAEIVGQLLHDLGSRSQVLCVTHQAQVASQGRPAYSRTENR